MQEVKGILKITPSTIVSCVRTDWPMTTSLAMNIYNGLISLLNTLKELSVSVKYYVFTCLSHFIVIRPLLLVYYIRRFFSSFCVRRVRAISGLLLVAWPIYPFQAVRTICSHWYLFLCASLVLPHFLCYELVVLKLWCLSQTSDLPNQNLWVDLVYQTFQVINLRTAFTLNFVVADSENIVKYFLQICTNGKHPEVLQKSFVIK